MADQSSSKSSCMMPILVKNLTFQVGRQRLVDLTSLEILAGGPTLILGPNGAGKSLFIRLLHGIIEPTSGTILFNGRVARQQFRRHQAMVFQKPVLLRRSVAANVAYALKVHGVTGRENTRQVDKYLELGGLSNHAKQSARSLSGGEQQRLALVRALACTPQVLFLDEPTSSLDPAASDSIETLISNAENLGTKIIMITHDLALAQRLAKDVIFMQNGQMDEHALAEKFFRSPASASAQAFLASKFTPSSEINGQN
ncbi:MAG: ATP-binding cassette domain-containing protein [Paracoccaceae bacterium]